MRLQHPGAFWLWLPVGSVHCLSILLKAQSMREMPQKNGRVSPVELQSSANDVEGMSEDWVESWKSPELDSLP